MKTRWTWGRMLFWGVLVVLLICFAALAKASLGPDPKPVVWTDTVAYMEQAEAPLVSFQFWEGGKPWVTVLLYKLAGQRQTRAVRMQIGLHVFSHAMLALVLFLILGQGSLGCLGAAGVLFYALSPHVNGWSVALLSESSTLSLTALFMALAMVVFVVLNGRGKCAIKIGGAGALLIGAWVFSSTRDQWIYQLPVLTLFFGAWAIVPGKWRSRRRLVPGLALSVGLLVIFGFQSHASRASGRWRPVLTNVLFQRVFPDPEIRGEWMRRWQMPMDATLERFAGDWAFSKDRSFMTHEAFQRWFTQRGMSAYARYLLLHPARHASEVWESNRRCIDSFCALYHNHIGRSTATARASERVLFFPISARSELFWSACLCTLLLIACLAGPRLAPVAWITLLFCAALPLQAAIGYLGDAHEVDRHSLMAGVLMRLIMILTLALALGFAAETIRTLLRIRRIQRKHALLFRALR